MKKYTQAEIKKFLEPETRFHMSAHVIQTEAVEMCRQLKAQLELYEKAFVDLRGCDCVFTIPTLKCYSCDEKAKTETILEERKANELDRVKNLEAE